jgi:hypothetical protein
VTTPFPPYQPAWQAPPVYQTSDGLRVMRLVLALLVTAGWVTDVLRQSGTSASVVGWSWSGLAWVVSLIWLIAGPQPRLATKWAWFWLFAIDPALVAFLLLEPVPAWQPYPIPARPSRLTGGWAFLLGILLAGVMTGVNAALASALHHGPFSPWFTLGGFSVFG